MNSLDRPHQDAPARWLRHSLLTLCRIGYHLFSFVTVVLVAWQVAGALASAQTVVSEQKNNAKTKTADEPKLGSDWVRLEHDERGQIVGMQTAVIRYARPAAPNSTNGTPKSKDLAPPDVVVDLIGAVHIADIAYYRQLNERFKQYDAVLYELVAPEGTVVERGRGTSNAHPVGAMQNAIKTFLELDHQLEYVDYTKPNLVHADLSPDQFFQRMRDRKETFLQLYFRMLGQAMAQQSDMTARGDSPDLDLFAALFATDRPRRLKIALAKQLAEMESLMVSFGGEQGSVLITERNKRALEVLRTQITNGKKKFGIFYGAGHLNDMDERLRNEFGLEPTEISWLTAWNLAPKR
jgi:hypothetical protein